ncbi:E3 SUMO-protein ligase PIAS1-like [Callorhinchus milii]|uniref:E3 SUMO-protein ligase PIAS1-like n=1 Tax=Callorhinchus milii TaxID=7868 RepID=UPI001C3FC41F|nr:E3 SUMO-protein ligase PIAS1-like [Callorhinchus milii]
MRLSIPCRATSCSHLQCFDAGLYLQMNEKKPTWVCPACDKRAPYDSLIIDGLFMEILSSCTHCDEIQFKDDGSWCPMQPKREKEFCAASYTRTDGTGVVYKRSLGDRRYFSKSNKSSEVIDLTLDSSSDEDEDEKPPLKKLCPVTASLVPSALSKQVVNLHHEPSSVLRRPPVTSVSADYLSSLTIPEYHPAYQIPTLPSDIQGLELFSFLQADNQHLSSSVISHSEEEQDLLRSPLSQFFQLSSSGSFLEPVLIAASSAYSSGAARLRDPHTRPLGGAIQDIISLD